MASQKRPGYRINLSFYRPLYWPLLLPVALLLALFNKLSPVPFKIYLLRVERVGQMAGNTEEFLCKLDLGLCPREFRVFIHRDYPSNQALLKVLKRALPIHQIFLPLFDVCYKLGGLGVTSLEHTHISGWDPQHLVCQTKQHLFLSDQEIQQARKECVEAGIDPTKPFIPVLGRDSAYLKSINEPTALDSYRNVDINTFVPAMEYLADTYQVMRMGSVVSDQLHTTHPNILDYSQSGHRSELLDVYLSAHCHFFFSCGTGLDSITWSFRRPVLYVDYIPLSFAPIMKPGSLMIFKKYWHIKEERYIGLQEALSSGIADGYTPAHLNHRDIVVHDNTPEEILEAAKEMAARLDGTWHESEEDIALQKRFWSYFEAHSPNNVCVTKVGASYLRNNLFLLD